MKKKIACIFNVLAVALTAWTTTGCASESNNSDAASPLSGGGIGPAGQTAASGTGNTATTGGNSATAATGGTGGSSGNTTVGGVGGTKGGAGASGKAGAPGKAGASGNNAGASGKAGASTGGAGRQAPATCPATSTWKAGDTNGSIQVGGAERTYILHVPPSYNGKTPVPLVLDFHGIGSTANQQQTVSGYPALGDQEGYVTVLPQGINNAWNIGVCCTESRDVDDVGFARALVAKLISEGCIDWKRVYAVGYSMGGGMSHYLACNAAETFASVAPAAFDLLTEEEEPCHPSRPITVISFRGTADPIVYYRAHESTPPTAILSGYSLDPIHFIGPVETRDKWAKLDGCTGSPEDKGGGCQTYTQCKAGVEVTLCTAEGGGHDPGDANVGWAMLKRHPMP